MRSLVLMHWFVAMAAPEPHVVAPGETLWSIARAHACTVADVRGANPELGDVLRAGIELALPSACRAVASPPRSPSPRERAVSGSRGTKVVPAPAAREVIVAKGDTLGRIASRNGTTVVALREANALSGNLIHVGQRLRLPEPPAPIAAPVGVGMASTARAVVDEPTPLSELPPPPLADAELPPPRARTRSGSGSSARATAPAHGRVLIGAVQLPADRAYYLRHPTRAWGQPHVVESTRAAIREVKRKYPRVHRLAIGDLSARSGGRLSGHKSHRTGRDVDLGLYFVRSPSAYPKRFVGADEAELDFAATWALIEAFHRQSKKPGGPTIIFLDFAVQGRIYEWARKHGVARRVLREVFQFPHGRWSHEGLVRHEPAHADHLHVRFGCPPHGEHCR